MNLRRRLLASLAFAPAAAWAQPAPGVHRIGTLSGSSSPKAKDQPNWPHFFAAMRQLGYEEGRNVIYEMRYAEGTPARFPQLARELIATGVELIVVTGATEAVAVSRATATIPIVSIQAADPVELGAFGVELRTLFARVPAFVDKILKGEKPGEIPIKQPTRFGLWLNLNTARTLGVKFPHTIMLRAERVIE